MIIPDGSIYPRLYQTRQVLFDVCAAGPTIGFQGPKVMQWRLGSRYLIDRPDCVNEEVLSALHRQCDGLDDFISSRLKKRAIVYSADQPAAICDVIVKTAAHRVEAAEKYGEGELTRLYDREMRLLHLILDGRPIQESSAQERLYKELRKAAAGDYADLKDYHLKFMAAWIHENTFGRQTYAVTPKRSVLRLARRLQRKVDMSLLAAMPYAGENNFIVKPAA